jgi:hypothetical protein
VLFFYAIITAMACSLPSRGAPAEGISQTEALAQAERSNAIGSDQSLRSSVTGAMQALLSLGENDLTGAAKGAYKAYGKFKNSENLDRVRKQSLLTKASMGSAETLNLTEGEVTFLGSSTSFRRLDPSFLSAGEDAQIAAEFERKTGIKRQDFLVMLADAAENKLYVSDPKLPEKIDAQFDGFLEKIPNAEFRAKVKEKLSIVPSLTRHKLLVQAVQKMVQVAGKFRAGGPAEADSLKVAGLLSQLEGARRPAGNGEPLPGEMMTTEETEGFETTGKLNADMMARRAEAKPDALKLESVVKAAISFDAANETIFQMVSRRYKLVAPRLKLVSAP